MKTKNHDDIPNDKWGLDRLGKFCTERLKRSAMDTVLIGRAIILAKDRCKKEGESFTDWKKEHGFSNATVSRYMRLAKSCKTDADVERLKSVGPLTAYIEAGIEAEREPAPTKASEKRSKAGAPSGAEADEPKMPSWAVDDTDTSANDAEPESQTIELMPISDSIQHELRDVVPTQVSHLKDRIAMLLGHDAEVLRAARPSKRCDRKKVAGEIDALVELLSRLAMTLRDEPASQPIAKTKQRKTKAA